MTRPDARTNPLLDFLALLWQQPLWAVPFALFFWLTGGANPAALGGYYGAALIFAYAIRLGLWVVRHLVLPRLPPPPADPARSLRWEVGLYYVAAGLLGSLLAALVVHTTVVPGFLGAPRDVTVWALYTLLFTTLFAGVNYAVAFYRQAVERGRAVERVRAELAQAELRALRAQIHPHFLFNTLNSIAALIGTNPRAAEETTTRLAEVFRHALRASEREHVPFADELEFLRAYLAIERTRFGGRLRVEERIEPGLESVPVPSLLLQPLVENAVRHAVAPRAEGATVRLAARRTGERLEVVVQDDGPGMDGDRPPTGEGFGLHSVRERLRAAGLADALSIDSRPGHGTTIRVSLPLRAAGSTSPPTTGGDASCCTE